MHPNVLSQTNKQAADNWPKGEQKTDSLEGKRLKKNESITHSCTAQIPLTCIQNICFNLFKKVGQCWTRNWNISGLRWRNKKTSNTIVMFRTNLNLE